jgi:hypothetical protein
MKPKKHIPTATLQAIDHQLQQMIPTFAGVERLTPAERKRRLKLRRGGQQIVPTIATVASKYGVTASNASGASLMEAMEYARAIEEVLGSAISILAALKDAQFTANADTWIKTITLYGMLRKNAEHDPAVAAEIASAAEWFRVRSRAGKHGAKAEDATPTATASTEPEG